MIDDAITTTIALAARTLFVATSCVTALLGILLLFAWRHEVDLRAFQGRLARA